MRSGGWLICFLLCGKILTAQAPMNYGQLDSLSAAYYLNEQWDQLHQLRAAAKKNGGPTIWRRLAHAEYFLAHYTASEVWIRKCLEQNPRDVFSQALLQKVLIAQGNTAAYRFLTNDSTLGIDAITLITGAKLSQLDAPGNLLFIGTEVRMHLHHQWSLTAKYAFQQQNYFWENSRQHLVSLQMNWQFNDRWRLHLSAQAANYSADIQGDYTDSLNIMYAADSGTLNQPLLWLPVWIGYNQNGWEAMLGASYLSSTTSASYQRFFTFPGFPEGPREDYSTTNRVEQFHIMGKLQYRLPVWKERIQLGLLAQQILGSNQLKVFNLSPRITLGPLYRTYLYGEYLEKGNYLMADAEQTWFWNSNATEQSRWLLHVQHFLSLRHELNCTWFYESGVDNLYFGQSLRYQGFFVGYTYHL